MLVGGPGGGYPQRKVVVAKPQQKQPEEPQRTPPDSTGARGYIIKRDIPQTGGKK